MPFPTLRFGNFYRPAGAGRRGQGPAKDCNIRVIFIDRADHRADGAPKPEPTGWFILAAPVKQTGGSNVGQMIIAGLSGAREVPGPFGNFELATSHKMTRSVADDGGAAIGEETWSFAAASGEAGTAHQI